MKKLYLEKKFKDFNLKRSLKAMQKMQTKKTNKRKKSKRDDFSKYRVSAPDIFSIIKNPSETISFFSKIEHTAFITHSLFIDIKNIKVITPETVLYLLLFVDKFKKNKKIKIVGNAPEDKRCREIFLHSGFYDYVNSSYATPRDINILSVKSDHIVSGEIADNVIEFACAKLNIKRSNITKAFYTTILECMGNTKEHAYTSHSAKYAKWWLIACHDSLNNCIDFSILDNGEGIPETVKKRFLENIFGYSDSKIISSVLNGEFRTSTQLQYRGKGLPKINSFMDEKIIQNLIIISNNGYYNADTKRKIELDKKFNGTMVCWSFIKGEQ